MRVYDRICFHIPGKGEYENFIDEDGMENESLNGAALKDGCFCKYYSKKSDWSDKSTFDSDGIPSPQHYCSKLNEFLGFSYCCWSTNSCFEKGKSAGVQRLRKKIRQLREEKGTAKSICE